jgi:uncharacterized protein YkwD
MFSHRVTQSISTAMRNIMLLVGVCCSMSAYTQADKYLAQIPKYNEASGFEDVKYKGMTWQQFYKLEAANELLDPTNYDFDLFNAAVFFSVNKYRSSRGVAVLQFEPRLRDAASIHADQMVKRHFFDHTNTHDAILRSLNNRTELCKYQGERIAENIAKTFIDLEQPTSYALAADKVVSELSKSPEHNEHLLDRKLSKLGCGAIFEDKPYNGQYHYFLLTQDFGKDW